MKTIKMIYVWSIYIVSTPIILLFGIASIIYLTIKEIIDCGVFETVKGYIGSFIDGIKNGHKSNMMYVNGEQNNFTKGES
jgi:hypothetical protein